MQFVRCGPPVPGEEKVWLSLSFKRRFAAAHAAIIQTVTRKTTTTNKLDPTAVEGTAEETTIWRNGDGHELQEYRNSNDKDLNTSHSQHDVLMDDGISKRGGIICKTTSTVSLADEIL